jgi:hypothetical protein
VREEEEENHAFAALPLSIYSERLSIIAKTDSGRIEFNFKVNGVLFYR